MIARTCFLLSILMGATAIPDSEYCKGCGEKSESHPMCKYKQQIGPNCGDKIFVHAMFYGFEDALQENLNLARSTYATLCSISNMKGVRWKSELAVVSQRICDQCFGSGDVPGELESLCLIAMDNTTFYVVPNLKAEETIVLQLLFEYLEYAYNQEYCPVDGKFPLASKSSDADKMFFRLMYPDLSRVGCGFAEYEAGTRTWTLMCSISPAPDIETATIFQNGTCKICPLGTECYGALCDELVMITKSTKSYSPNIYNGAMAASYSYEYLITFGFLFVCFSLACDYS